MSNNILLKKVSAGNWIYDGATTKYYLMIGSSKVAELDSNGNLRIMGDIITNETIS